ncbi:hypothetical protein D3C76_1258430 [compost metagenome]
MPQHRILLQRRELARAVVNKEDLHQQRGAGKQGDVAAHDPHQHRRFQRQDDGENQRQHQRHDNRGGGQRQAGMQPFHQFG